MQSRQMLKILFATVFTLGLVACKTTTAPEENLTQNFDEPTYVSDSNVGKSNVVTAGIGADQAFPGKNVGVEDPDSGEKSNTIYFGFDQVTIEPKYMQIIEENARYLKTHPNARIRLEGHTDPRGSREYNIGLGQRRGQRVDDQLQVLGIPARQLVVVSYGKEKLARVGTTADDYRLDRRVEIIYENS